MRNPETIERSNRIMIFVCRFSPFDEFIEAIVIGNFRINVVNNVVNVIDELRRRLIDFIRYRLSKFCLDFVILI